MSLIKNILDDPHHGTLVSSSKGDGHTTYRYRTSRSHNEADIDVDMWVIVRDDHDPSKELDSCRSIKTSWRPLHPRSFSSKSILTIPRVVQIFYLPYGTTYTSLEEYESSIIAQFQTPIQVPLKQYFYFHDDGTESFVLGNSITQEFLQLEIGAQASSKFVAHEKALEQGLLSVDPIRDFLSYWYWDEMQVTTSADPHYLSTDEYQEIYSDYD